MTTALCYPARINSLAGEPGGGKTWVALHACAQAMRRGLHIIYIDLEDHFGSTLARLQALGATREHLTELFHYSRPGGGMEPEHFEYLEWHIRHLGVAMVVIDSVGELMSMQGIKPNDDDAVARFYRAIPRRLADLGPAVLLLDHVPKDKETAPLYAIGSQRKKAAIDGAAFMVETAKAFSAEVPGKILLRTAKDRAGNFVAGMVAAEITVEPSEGGSRLDLKVRKPEMAADGTHQRRTGIMRKVSEFLDSMPGVAASTNRIEASVKSKDYLRSTLKDMVDEGWLLTYEGERKAVMWALVERFDESLTPPSHRNAVAIQGSPEDEF
jgi:hypothetical protein